MLVRVKDLESCPFRCRRLRFRSPGRTIVEKMAVVRITVERMVVERMEMVKMEERMEVRMVERMGGIDSQLGLVL